VGHGVTIDLAAVWPSADIEVEQAMKRSSTSEGALSMVHAIASSTTGVGGGAHSLTAVVIGCVDPLTVPLRYPHAAAMDRW
jgi:hypothetical protein